MSAAETATTIASRMEAQRAQLQRQFVRPAAVTASVQSEVAPHGVGAMQPYEPKSFLMKLLRANPQILQRVLLLAASAALGARYSSWAVRLLGLFLSTRRR